MVIQQNNYYPLGLSFGEESDLEQGLQNFKYNGKELDKERGLNQYDYAARYMDPATVRFTTVDPHSENYYSWSPYVYVGNNPMRFVDPNGKDGWDFLYGIVDAVKSNSTMGATDAGGITLQGSVDNPGHYNSGRTVGDVASVVMGVIEIVVGGASAGAAATAPTGVGLGVSVAGVSVVVHGGATIGKALQGTDRMEMSGNSKGTNSNTYEDITNKTNKGSVKNKQTDAKRSEVEQTLKDNGYT